MVLHVKMKIIKLKFIIAFVTINWALIVLSRLKIFYSKENYKPSVVEKPSNKYLENIKSGIKNNSVENLKPKLFESPLKKYPKSHVYLINNNLAQYSSHITKYENKLIIDIFFQMNWKYISDLFNKNKYLCVLKYFDLSLSREEIIELQITSSNAYYFVYTQRMICELKKNNINLKNLVVAIIRIDEYDKHLNESMLNSRININGTKEFDKVVLPFSLINFQKPIIFNTKRKISKSVSLCIPFLYGENVNYLVDSINFNLNFGYSEIMFYDSTPNELMKQLLKSDTYKNEKRIKFKLYRIEKDDICSKITLANTNFTKIEKLMRKNCELFFNLEFRNSTKTWDRQKHEQITSNDCVTIMKKSHEFKAYYDLDEFIFPRTYEMKFNHLVNCNSSSTNQSSMKPFEFKKENFKASFIYNYLDSLIEQNRDGRDRNMLSTISFQHVVYTNLNYNIEKLFKDMGEFISTNITKSDFPFTLYIGDEPKLHKFIIGEKDLDHVKYLHNSYNTLKFLLSKSLNISLNNLYQRYIYIITEYHQRMPKCIYYYKNINAVFVHYAYQTTNGSWTFTPSIFKGNFVSHFREDFIPFFDIKLNMPILNLNIDLEYLSFIAKNTGT